MDEALLERQLADIFFVESGEMLSEASLALLRAEEAENPQEAINQVFRAIHSIKGGAQSLGFEQLSEVAHSMEDFLVPLRNGCAIGGQVVSLILEAMDVIEMQLSAFQAGEPPADCAELLALLAGYKEPTEGAGVTVMENTTSSQEIASTAHGARLLYLSFTVDPAAPMPVVTAVILLEQLRQAGRLLYSHPDIDSLGMAVVGECYKQTAIFQTDMCNADMEQVAYNVGDICDLKVAEIDNGIFPNADKPAKAEIAYFNTLVGNMQEMLCCKHRDKASLNKIARQIVNWGGDSCGAAGWFPGGFSAWQRMTSLLTDTVALTEDSKFSCEMTSVTAKTLQVLWETVYHVLCNHTYFYSLPVNDILDGNGLRVIEQFKASAVDLQVVNIDLSKLMTLEGEHLRTLADFRDNLIKNGWILWLISEGNYTRRHLNVLEISEELVGDLELYSSSYSAVVASNKIGRVGEDRHVSKIQGANC